MIRPYLPERATKDTSNRNSGLMIDRPHELTSDDCTGHGDVKAMIAPNRQAITFAQRKSDGYGITPDCFDPRSGR